MLERVLPDGPAIAGDLTEEFERGRSRAWFWWQALAAVAIASFGSRDEIRPLRLVDLQPNDAQQRTRRLMLRVAPVNLTASPLPGIGGLGIVLLAALVSLTVPAVWLVHLASVLAGILLGLGIIALERRRVG
jgi:hypothetical protein